MSAFLGPIHFWLYNKIKMQEGLTNAICEAGEESGWKALSSDEQRQKFTVEELQPLESLIDVSNIHGWLQNRIDEAETRFAALVTAILREEPDRLPDIRDAAFRFGTANRKTAETAMDAYRLLDETLLDGMPCDNVNQVVQNEFDDYRWNRTQDLHGKYWTDPAAGPAVYYQIRESLIEGLLDGTGFSYTDEDGACRIA